MSTQRVVAAVSIAFIAFFAFLTISAAIERGVDVLTIVSLAVLVLLAVGVIGAFSQGPRE